MSLFVELGKWGYGDLGSCSAPDVAIFRMYWIKNVSDHKDSYFPELDIFGGGFLAGVFFGSCFLA